METTVVGQSNRRLDVIAELKRLVFSGRNAASPLVALMLVAEVVGPLPSRTGSLDGLTLVQAEDAVRFLHQHYPEKNDAFCRRLAAAVRRN